MGFKLSKKKLQEHGRENMEEILNDIDANESVIMGMGFLLWNSINEAYKIGYEGGEVASEIGIDNVDCICGVSHISGANSRPAVVCSQCNGVIKQG